MVQPGIEFETILLAFLFCARLYALLFVSLTLELCTVLVSKRDFPIKAFGCGIVWEKKNKKKIIKIFFTILVPCL